MIPVSVSVLSACAMKPEPLTNAQFSAKGVEDRAAMFKEHAPLVRPLTLPDAMARVLRHNLDRRAKMMEEALALGQLDLDRFDLLPKLTTSAGYLNRSDHATTTSRDSVTLQPSLSNPSYSTDRDHRIADLTLSWNILDFGVSWFTAHQNADRALIASERRRKTVANLMQEVRFAYWRALAAQQLEDPVKAVILEGEKALSDADKVQAEQLRNPVESLRFQKTLLENLRQLEAIQQELTSARSELAALINVAPGDNFRLAVPAEAEMKLPEWGMTVETMEETAFASNPDLREQVYQSRIAVDETRKAILRMLPGISLSFSRQYDSNSFLVNNSWQDASARLTWNLFNILSGPVQIEQANAGEQVADAKRLALRMAVLAQVHVARSQFGGALRQFDRSDRLYRVEVKLAETTARRQESDAQSVTERISSQTSAIAAELRRYQTFAQAQAALGRMQTTIGMDPLPPEVASRSLDDISAIIAQKLKNLDQGIIDNTPLPAAQPQQPGSVPATEPPPKPTAEGTGTTGLRARIANLFSASGLFQPPQQQADIRR
ncbi:MAG: TolC family protein [Rhodospirillales bacterium]|nr:TolC family protein [Rhodospirillales bacterium]